VNGGSNLPDAGVLTERVVGRRRDQFIFAERRLYVDHRLVGRDIVLNGGTFTILAGGAPGCVTHNQDVRAGNTRGMIDHSEQTVVDPPNDCTGIPISCST